MCWNQTVRPTIPRGAMPRLPAAAVKLSSSGSSPLQVRLSPKQPERTRVTAPCPGAENQRHHHPALLTATAAPGLICDPPIRRMNRCSIETPTADRLYRGRMPPPTHLYLSV
jgi:hypothetical protein